jgi:adenylate cyclase
VQPDYALGYEVVMLLLAGLTLAFALPLLSATRAVLVSVGRRWRSWSALNYWLYLGTGWCCRWRRRW